MKNWVKLFPHKFILWVLIGSISAALLSVGLSSPVQAGSGLAAPVMQVPIYTPTPLPDGRIIYIVKLDDSLLSISLITGVSVDELRGMNNLTSDIIFVGQQLLLGFGGPAEILVTPGPTPTTTAVLPSPTPQSGTGNLCILLFNDINGDSLRQGKEPSLAGGAISINNRAASVSQTVDTAAGFEPHCFDGLAEGQYTISVAVPAGFNPTTNTNYEIELNAGDETYVDFGAQANSETLAEAPILPQEGEKSPILGIIGGLILLAGVGVALFAGRLLKGR